MIKIKRLSHFPLAPGCILAGLTAFFSLGRISDSVSSEWLKIALRSMAWAALVLFLSSIFIWQYFINRTKLNRTSAKGFTEAALIYFLAFDFTKWGLLKILHLHMTTSLGWMEMPMTMLSGEQQLSHFFGQNYPMLVSLGVCEIAGAIFLLFRQTRLLGAFMLFVMASNIVLLDFFYDIRHPLPEALILLCGVLYIALLDYQKIAGFFFTASSHLAKYDFKNQFFKTIIRFSALAIPALLLIPNNKNQLHANLTGKYAVLKMSVNRKERKIDPCSDSSVSNVYFDLGDFFVFSYNHFNRRKVGKLIFNDASREFKSVWVYPKGNHDTLNGKVSKVDNQNRMSLSGIMGKDTLQMELLKVKVKSVSETY